MKVLKIAADRLLGAFVPEITAGACCSDNGKVYYVSCGCSSRKGAALEKRCVVDCYCHGICGPCNIYYPDPGCIG